jgi:hypothetical protein
MGAHEEYPKMTYMKYSALLFYNKKMKVKCVVIYQNNNKDFPIVEQFSLLVLKIGTLSRQNWASLKFFSVLLPLVFPTMQNSMFKYEFINPCHVCEHPHACDECPVAGNNPFPKALPRTQEGKINIASGEDAAFVREEYVVS